MKKLIVLPLLALFIASCSTDDLSSEIQENNLETIDSETARNTPLPGQQPSGQVRPCFESLTGEVIVNLPGGLGGMPELNFIANGQGADWQAYDVYLVFENLVDCEELGNGTGETSTFFLGSLEDLDTVNAMITLKPTDLPQGCYRWRFIYERRSTKRFTGCSSYSPWYDSPLF
ncbi:MAG: hypothetical protein ACO1N9_08455 [Flavobacterium sp.]